VRLYRPKTQFGVTPVLLWLHGGGFIMGRPEQDEALCSQLGRELGIGVVSVDYRCAPEHPFPAALEDGYSALCWIAAQDGVQGLDASRIAIGGASAGGGLAAALVQYAHDRGQVPVCFQLLVYPMLDDRTVLRGELEDRGKFVWTQASNRYGWESYLKQPCGAADAPAYAVPARRADLTGLPPAWIGVGTLDLFHDEDLAYAQRLKDCGVACDVHIVPGAFHGFDAFGVMGSSIPLVQDFHQVQIAALKKHLFLSVPVG
jgi:acetyl esterase/lipase